MCHFFYRNENKFENLFGFYIKRVLYLNLEKKNARCKIIKYNDFFQEEHLLYTFSYGLQQKYIIFDLQLLHFFDPKYLLNCHCQIWSYDVNLDVIFHEKK